MTDNTFRDRIINIDRRRVGDVEPNARNPKRYTDEKNTRLTAVLSQFGKAGVLLTYFDERGVECFFDGNTRSRIDPDEVWYIAQTDLTQKEVDDLVMLYDPLAAPDWDAELFKQLMKETAVTDETLTGMMDEIAAAIGAMVAEPQESKDAEPQLSRADELQKIWGVELGQMWRLPSRVEGQEHRLICGDCTDAAVVARLEPPFDMMFTDPPYGVDYSGGIQFQKDGTVQKENRKRLEGDTVDMYSRFLPVVLPLINGPCYVWFAASVGKPVYDAILDNGGEIHAMLIWHKTNAKYAAMNAQYKQRHEPFMYFKRKGQTLRWCGATTEPTVWEMPRDPISDLHPTQKPIALAQRAIGNHDVMTIADFFCGSGSTMIASENLSRQCRAVEISPAYCAVSLQRYQDAFNITPELIT